MWGRRWTVCGLVLAVSCTTTVGCGGEGDERQYVALGDSYTAGPSDPEDDATKGCLRSATNYPSLLAGARDLVLVDVSCAGADTSSLVEEQVLREDGAHPPQADALSESTDLVTVSLGANDRDFAEDWLYTCMSIGLRRPGGDPCTRLDAEQDEGLEERLTAMTASLERSLTLVQERAPSARVLVVGYPRIIPDEGECQERLPFALGDYDWARSQNLALRDAVALAADRADVELIDLWAASQGHDICSADPWFRGYEQGLDPALMFHPVQAFHDAVAELLLERV